MRSRANRARSAGRLLSTSVLLLLAGCPSLFGPPRHITDAACREPDAGARRGDVVDRSALRRLASVPGFPRVEDPKGPGADAAIATAAVAVGAAMGRGPQPDLELRHAVQFVLRRRRREAFRAIARALDGRVPEHRAGAFELVHDVNRACRPRRTADPSPCRGWPERDELIRSVVRAATSDPDAEVRRIAVAVLRMDLSDAAAPTTEDVLTAIDREPDPGVRASWFDVLEGRPPPPAAAGIAVAGRLAAEGVRVIEFLAPYLVESNRSLLEEAYRHGGSPFRRALGNAIFDRREPLPWTVTIVEQGLFDEDPDVRACFAGAVTALDPVPAALRARLEATAATRVSSASALSFLRAKAERRPLR